MSDPSVQSPARAQLEQWLRGLSESPAYRNYELARERVLDMKDRAHEAAGVDVPSAYWRGELQNLDYMIDASPIVIDKLRHHCFYLTGIRPYDYRRGKPERPVFFEHKLNMLIDAGGRDLLVPESPILGGFGYDIAGALYNIDTFKFYEVMIGMDRGGALDAFRTGEGRFVCEIGSGWGGFAYQFKTLFPNATIILVDFAELFLFSATYLMTAFPEARVLFWEPGAGDDLAGPDRPDFVFVPHNEIEDVEPPQLDATVNMVSFQEMTTDQVRSYVRWAAGNGSPYLYSLNRDRSPYNPELMNVREVMHEAYDLQEIEILPMAYSKIVDPRKLEPKKPKPKSQRLATDDVGRRSRLASMLKPDEPAPAPPPAPTPPADHLDYRHVVGKLRGG